MRRAAAAVALAGVALAARAAAQPAGDFDEAEEQRSDFWERGLRPHGEDYEGVVRRAQLLIESNSAQQLAEAEPLLVEAAALEPHNPAAWWWLGELYARQEKWQPCAEARERVFRLEAGFRSPSPRDESWALDQGLGICLAHAGDYEGSIFHLKRVLAGGGSNLFLAHWRLGNSLMALGRLDEAIEAFETAYKQRPNYDYAMVNFVLAAAYDRDEQVARSREQLDEALRRDPRLGSLTAPPVGFLPEADEDYYQGLASRAQGRRSWAIIFFRRYLHRAGEAPWVRRAKAHLAELGRLPMSGDEIAVRGPAPVDKKQVDTAVLRHRDELERCLADTPNLLVRVRSTVFARAGKGRRGRPAARALGPATFGDPNLPQGGVRATRELDFATENEAIRNAIVCVEEVARKVAWPQPIGDPSTFVMVELFVVGP